MAGLHRKEGKLYRLSEEELRLVQTYRTLCKKHQIGLIWFATASHSSCGSHLPANVVYLVPRK
jgi:hypothetical protein